MPPVTRPRRLAPGFWRGSTSRGGRSAAPRFRRQYRKGTKIGARKRAVRGQGNVIKLTTLSKKQEMVSIEYRETFDMQSMGYGAASATQPLQTPFLLRTNLNNPVIGGLTGTTRNINTVVSKLQQSPPGTAISTDPIFTRESYQDDPNLAGRLSEYFDEYRSCVVVSSEVTYSVRPKLNQVGRLGFAGAELSLIPWMTNATDTQGDTRLQTNEANVSGQLVVWNVRQGQQSQLYDNTGVFKNSDLKLSVPGMRFTSLNVTPNSARGCVYKMKYSPSTQFQIKDWRDNKEELEIKNVPLQAPGVKQAYSYLGIGIEGASGTRFAWQPTPCIVEVSIKYNLAFSERRNVRGNNEPIPHASEL